MPRKKRPKPPVGAAKFADSEVIGEGQFGTVFRMRDITTQEQVAVKQMPRGPQIDKYVYREMINHKRLLHRNVVQFKEVYLTDSHINVVMEHAAGGDLFTYVQKHVREKGAPLPEHHALFFFHQILCGVAYMHMKGVCHRDLKLENILLDYDGIAGGEHGHTVKICDFGFSKSMHHSDPRSFVGTTCYCAPEILQARQQEFPYSGEVSDVWSMGVMLYLMVCGKLPFGADDGASHAVMARVVKGEYVIPEGVLLSESCKSLLSSILIVDPSKRIRLESIWEHPWMKEGGIQKATLEDEGIMSSQSDENITSLCLEALNQDEDQFPPAAADGHQQPPPTVAGNGMAEPQPEDGRDATEQDEVFDDLLMDDEELSSIIHMGSDEPPCGGVGGPADDFSSIIHMGTEDCSPFLQDGEPPSSCGPQDSDFGEMMRMTSNMSIGPRAISGMSTEGLPPMGPSDLPSQEDMDGLHLLSDPSDVGMGSTGSAPMSK